MRRVTAAATSPRAIVAGPQSAEVSESENTTFGISFIGGANGPVAVGQYPAQDGGVAAQQDQAAGQLEHHLVPGGLAVDLGDELELVDVQQDDAEVVLLAEGSTARQRGRPAWSSTSP